MMVILMMIMRMIELLLGIIYLVRQSKFPVKVKVLTL